MDLTGFNMAAQIRIETIPTYGIYRCVLKIGGYKVYYIGSRFVLSKYDSESSIYGGKYIYNNHYNIWEVIDEVR